MSNKTTLQENNVLLDGYITRVNTAKDTASALPDASSSGDSTGGTSIETSTFQIKMMKNPMSSTCFVEKICYSGVDSDGVFALNDLSVSSQYILTIESVAVETLIFVKTKNNPTACTINNSGLELVSFNSAYGAVIKVVSASGTESGFSIVFS